MKLVTAIFGRSDWYVTSPFGWRRDPISGESKLHAGCDYGTYGQKWSQYALENGTIDSAGMDSSGAMFCWVRYPRIGKRLLHYHLDSVVVKTGQTVTKGTLLGYTGTTGYSTGIHLHLGMQSIGNTTYEDPHAYDYVEELIPVPSSNIKVGSLVAINKGAKSYEGVTMASFVFGPQYNVYELNGNRAVLDKDGINTAFKTSDLTLVQNPSEVTNELVVGDRVKILKTGAGDSYGGSGIAYGIGWDDRYITAIYHGRSYPYQVGNKGKTDGSNTTGFYKVDALQKL